MTENDDLALRLLEVCHELGLLVPEQVAILGVSRSSIRPYYVGERFEPRTRLPLSLSYDHRIIDGADAARFLRWICDSLKQPLHLFFDTPPPGAQV